VDQHSRAFVGIDRATRKLAVKLAAKYRQLTFCCEAGPTGYGLYRLSRELGAAALSMGLQGIAVPVHASADIEPALTSFVRPDERWADFAER
jgi:hypothetical protein